MNRYRNSHDRHRRSHSRCCSTDRPRGLWGNPPTNCKINTFIHLNFLIFKIRRAYARIFTFLLLSLCRFAPALARSALRSRILLRNAQRLERSDAFRDLDFAAEGETRTDVRARMRRIVTAIRTTDTGVRIRVAARPKDHTACCRTGHKLVTIVCRGASSTGRAYYVHPLLVDDGSHIAARRRAFHLPRRAVRHFYIQLVLLA